MVSALLAASSSDATWDDYQTAFVDDNALLKPSRATHARTCTYLGDRPRAAKTSLVSSSWANSTTLLMPVATRRDLMNVSDEIAAKVDVRFYTDARDAFLKAVTD